MTRKSEPGFAERSCETTRDPFAEGPRDAAVAETEEANLLAQASTERPTLRVVAGPEDEHADLVQLFQKDVAEHRPEGRNRIARFMTAYADAIDRDIRLLLES